MVDEREVFAGRVVRLVLRGRYEVVEHVGGAAVVAVDAADQVLLVRQLRPAVGARLLELPAGLLDPGESALECARRELEEETGFTASRLEPLAAFYTSPGFSTERLQVFAGFDLHPCRVAGDDDEEIEVVRLPLAAAIARLLDDEVSDAKTITGLLAFQRRYRSTGR